MGVDSNNCIYPVAYALVEAETTESWTWFLECLGRDLDLYANSNFTFISDRQKGVIPALKKTYPSVEHIFCLRHIHENMKSKWRGHVFKDLLWKCATTTTIPQFEKAMTEVKVQDQALHDWLRDIHPKHWSKAYFSGRSTSDVLLNNLSKVFNRKLVGGRDKPIITCLEFIREYLMKRIVLVRKSISKCDGPLTPKATTLFEGIKKDALLYKVIWNGMNKYQVSGPSQDQCVVDVDKKTCSCGMWELIAIPCKHAVAVNYNMAQNGMDVDIPEAWISKVYLLDTWKKVYDHTIDPINGVQIWTPSECPTTLKPPKHHKQIGRPKKKRKKSAEELSELAREWNMPRSSNTVTCKNCKTQGHNIRSCTAPNFSSQPEKKKGTAKGGKKLSQVEGSKRRAAPKGKKKCHRWEVQKRKAPPKVFD
ncbi:uncharacterized protein LOC143565425 [Bidens hawaiensis]|uniref:uncharacterized protein LOC143565425 n=1 Tax=Bidens hawaiensis TaxID=980011 RepID=UPI004049142E